MAALNGLERNVLAMLFAGESPTLQILREQLELSDVTRRDVTGGGFITTFRVNDGARCLPGRSTFHFGDVSAIIDELRYGAGFVVFIKNGYLDALEGYSYDEPWPVRISCFELSYLKQPRELALPSA